VGFETNVPLFSGRCCRRTAPGEALDYVNNIPGARIGGQARTQQKNADVVFQRMTKAYQQAASAHRIDSKPISNSDAKIFELSNVDGVSIITDVQSDQLEH
jgi:hypothetical protein